MGRGSCHAIRSRGPIATQHSANNGGIEISGEWSFPGKDLRYNKAPNQLIAIEDPDGECVTTSEVSIPNAYTSLAFDVRVSGFPGSGGRSSSGALPRWKPMISADHNSGREVMKQEPNPAMRGVPSGLTRMFCCKDVSFWRFRKYGNSDDLTEPRRPWTTPESWMCFNPWAIPRT